MATHGKYDTTTVTASEALEVLHRAITYAGAYAANTVRAAGILVSKGRTGEFVTAATAGEVKVQIGAAVSTIGYPLTITTSGFLIAASSGGASVGRSQATGSSGDIIPAIIDLMTINAWPGV